MAAPISFQIYLQAWQVAEVEHNIKEPPMTSLHCSQRVHHTIQLFKFSYYTFVPLQTLQAWQVAEDAHSIEERVDDAIDRIAERVATETPERAQQLSDKINEGAETVTARADDYAQQASDVIMRQAKTASLLSTQQCPHGFQIAVKPVLAPPTTMRSRPLTSSCARATTVRVIFIIICGV